MADWFDVEINKVMDARTKLRRSNVQSDRPLLEQLEDWLEIVATGLPGGDRTFVTKQYKLVEACKKRGFKLPVLASLHPIGGNLWSCFPEIPATFEPQSLRTVYANSCAYVNAACDELRGVSDGTIVGGAYEKWFGAPDHLKMVRVRFGAMQRALTGAPLILAKMPQGQGFDNAFGAAVRRGETVKLAYGKTAVVNVVYIGNIFWEKAAPASLAEIERNFGNDDTEPYQNFLKEHTVIHEVSHLAANTEDVSTKTFDPSKIGAIPKGENRVSAFVKNRQKLKQYHYAGHGELFIETMYGSPLSKMLARARPDLAAKNADNYAYFALHCGVPGVRARFIKRDARDLPDPTN